MFKHHTTQIILLCILSIYIISIGYHHGVISTNGSQELKYFPSKLLREDVDFNNLSLIYSVWFMSQRPEYLHQ